VITVPEIKKRRNLSLMEGINELNIQIRKGLKKKILKKPDRLEMI